MSADNPQSIDLLLRRFRQLYGEGGANVLRAPARINILGEHVDYVSYLATASLAFGSHEHAMAMVFRPTGDGKIRGASTNGRFQSFDFSIGEMETPSRDEQDWEAFVFNCPTPAPHWSNYVKGAVSFAEWKFGASVKHGFEFLIDSTIPSASGASSSSALVVLAGAAIRLANAIEYENGELAIDSSQAEWFLGTRGGALDHTAICLAKPGQAVHIFHSEKSAELLPLPEGNFRWLTFFSHPADKGREVMLEYNERAAVSRLLIPAFLDGGNSIETLPEAVTLAEIAKFHPAVFADCERTFPALVSERSALSLKLRNRARHHSGEVERVAFAVKLLRRSPDSRTLLAAIGRLINQSHESLRDLYEVSTPEVESLIEAIRADELVYGARLMGGGFGGNVLALTTTENVNALIKRVQREYYTPRNRDCLAEASVMISTPGQGISILNLDS